MNYPRLTTLVSLCACLVIISGCATRLEPGGPYTDAALYRADQVIVQSYDALHGFVRWESEHRATLERWPEIRQMADFVRASAKGWIRGAIATRDAYAASSTPPNRDALEAAIAVLQTAMSEAATLMQRGISSPVSP